MQNTVKVRAVSRPASPAPTPAVHAAMRIMRLIRDSAEALGVSDIAGRLELNKSTVFGIVRTLAAESMIVEVGDSRRYLLGAALVEMAEAVRGPRTAIVRPYMDRLADELNLPCFLAMPYSEREFLILERAENTGGIRVTVSVGERFPLTAGALGKAYLAWRPTAFVLDVISRVGLAGRPGSAIGNAPDFLKELVRVRAQGFSESYEEYQVDINALAAPVFDNAGEVAMLLLIVGLPNELNKARMRRYGPQLRAVADEVARAFGGHSRYGKRERKLS